MSMLAGMSICLPPLPGWTDPDLWLDGLTAPPQPVPDAARPVAGSLVRVLAEVLMGQRSPEQLGEWLHPDQIARLTTLVRQLRGVKVRIQRCTLVSTAPERVEGTVLLHCGERRLAAAIRLDERDGRWVCGQLELLLPEGISAPVRPRWDYVRGRA